MVWFGLRFDTVNIPVTLSQEKLMEIMMLIGTWLHKEMATIQELHSLLGKLIYVAQCCPPARPCMH